MANDSKNNVTWWDDIMTNYSKNSDSWWDGRNPFNDEDHIYWAVHMGTFAILAVIHIATLLYHRKNWHRKWLPGEKACTNLIHPELTIYPAPPSEQVANSPSYQWKECLRFKLTMLERPMILDIVHWIGMFIIIICIWSRSKELIIGTSFVALFDFMQFVYMIKLYPDPKPTKFRIQLTYAVIAGFPMGTIGKMVLALSMDGYIQLYEVLGVYQYVFEAIAGIILIISIIAIFALCDKSSNHDDDASACTCFILTGIIILIFACAGVAMAVMSYLYMKQQNIRVDDLKTMLNIDDNSAVLKSCPCWTWAFLVIWIPLMIASLVFLYVSSKDYGFYFIPDYITLHGFYLSTVILAYHLDTFDGTTMPLITNGYMLFPLIMCLVLTVIYHLVDVHGMTRQMTDVHGMTRQMKKEGYELFRVTGQTRRDIEHLFKSTWKKLRESSYVCCSYMFRTLLSE
ncbi:unnamed protein product [Owenia fusiformis]|uniref:Uncharacterized protein n=1 Tax=Owenia fusiformis TaxID=6347 RepID=A0A8S4MYB1_OWEFU|nr:unnamed protein product [Owenia fusiformis]